MVDPNVELTVSADPLEALKSYPITVLLIDDQPIIAEAVRRMLEDQDDIIFHYCQDPSKAIQMATKVSPTVILQDLVMPDIDGLMLVKYFRANPSTSIIPMIVLSTKEEPEIKAEAFALGANDYIVKLPDKVELIARVRYHSRAYIGLMQRNEAYSKLKESETQLQEELTQAASYVRSLLPEPLQGEITASWRFIPSMQLGGDSFGYHWLDDQHFAIYLLDVCGHGVGAALLSISAMNVLRSQTLPETNFYDPANVLSSLNETFPMEQHNNMFFTMWYGVYNKEKREITYASGGHPPAILISGDSQENARPVQLKTPGLVIGGMPEAKFESDTCKVGDYNQFYLFSDGVYELDKADGTMLQLEEFIDELAKPTIKGEQTLDHMVSFAKDVIQSDQFADDFCIMEINFLNPVCDLGMI